MKKIIISILIGLCFIALGLSVKVSNAEAPQVPLQEQSSAEIVRHFTNLYGSDYDLVMSVLFCESNFRMVPGDGGKSYGHAQYFKETFTRHSKALGEDLNYESSFDQLKLISFDYSYSEAYRKEWTTYRAIQNGGTYIFTDRNGITHTVKCQLKDWE
jgi:hypothetical protein